MFKEQLLKLTKHLYPDGRAFRLYDNNVIGQLHKALMQSENRFLNDLKGIYDSILPDNFNFTTEDAEDWERRLGLPTNPNLTLQQRKLAIKRKLNHPGDILGRQSIEFIQYSIQQVFPSLYVHQNNFSGVAKAPYEVAGTMHSTSTEHGSVTHGNAIGDVIIDYLEPNIDEDRYFDYVYSTGSTVNLENFYRFTFFVADKNLEFVDIPANQQRQLRQIILNVIPANMICFAFVNYV